MRDFATTLVFQVLATSCASFSPPKLCTKNLMNGPGNPLSPSKYTLVSSTMQGPLWCLRASCSLKRMMAWGSSDWISGSSIG